MGSNPTAQYDYTTMIEGFKSHSPRHVLTEKYALEKILEQGLEENIQHKDKDNTLFYEY